MAVVIAAKAARVCYLGSFLRVLSIHSGSLFQSRSLEESIETVIANKSYQQILGLLNSWKGLYEQHTNPFSFLSGFPSKCRTQVIDEILQSLVPSRPRSRSYIAYEFLLSYTLQSSQPFPIALAVLQRTIRAGCIPVPDTQLLLSSAWLDHRHRFQRVTDMLLDMKSIGYRPDTGTCNYIILALCGVDQLEEAIELLRGMTGVTCIPDLESFGVLIVAMCRHRRTSEALAMMKEMVGKFRLSPRQHLLVKLASSLRANKEMWRAVELIEFLEEKGIHIEFESYEVVVKGCLECTEFLLAGKVAARMAQRGFIPYIKLPSEECFWYIDNREISAKLLVSNCVSLQCSQEFLTIQYSLPPSSPYPTAVTLGSSLVLQ
ncbi:hypothetical protein Dimus_019855 [Dionaea muscipula]